MALFNLSEAAKRAGISRNTLYKHIENGKLSVQTNAQGNKQIDSTELLRVYGSLNGKDAQYSADTPQKVNTQKPASGQLEVQLAIAEERVKQLEIRLQERDEATSKIEQQYERVIKSLESQILLLEHKAEPVQQPQPTALAQVEVPKVQHQTQDQDDKRKQALQMQAKGLSQREIAKALGIGKSTVGDWLREMRVRKAKKH